MSVLLNNKNGVSEHHPHDLDKIVLGCQDPDCLRCRLVSPTTHALFKEITPLMCCDLPGKVCADACDACKTGVACDCPGAVTG